MKIALIGGAKIYHGMTFAEMFNGYDEKLSKKLKWGPQFKERVGGTARITHVWDENIEAAKESARVCGIPHVVKNKEDVIGQVDGVLVADDCTLKHQRKAIPFLKAGIPTFIDKPLSPDLREAETIAKLAKKHRAPLMSCSALRFAKETKALREGKDSIGEIRTGFAACRVWMGGLVFYGIHAVELLLSLTGPGVRSVVNLGRKKRDFLVLTFKDERRFSVATYEEDIGASFQVCLYGEKGHRVINAEDGGYFYSEMLRQFVKMVETGKSPVPMEDTLETIRIVTRGNRPSKDGKQIKIG
ncbi:MAG: Gfo/Idh/MocA family oxidoreductase [Verrucomicrobiae bacterium]|nr:Gfo/Idh/MocA family oxidoreductase [Verrucomicrobiae bacterium]